MLTSIVGRVLNGLLGVVHELTDSYRPELHYMRGPGPRWHERHGTRTAP